MKRFQALNKTKFAAKWDEVLQRDHLPSDPRNVFRAARLRQRAEPAVLVIDSYVPLYDKEAGSNRLKRLIDGFRDAGVRVVFFPDNLTPLAPYTQQLQRDGVEVIYSPADPHAVWRELLIEALQTVDVAWICRPDLFCKYAPTIRAHARIPLLYDTIDLHHLRLRRQAATEAAADDLTWRKSERLELACANAADRTIVVSDYEARLLAAAGIPNVAIVPTVHDVERTGTFGFDKTTGLLFIGGYNHLPNVDAATWLVREIMPLVWAQLPDLVVTLLGSNPPEAVRNLADERVIVPGFVSDNEVAKGFRAARVFVAPLRFGAGLKGKIGQALAFGTPIVSTPVGVEGFHLSAGTDVLVAADAAEFAAAILRLYADADLWSRLSAASAAALEPFGARRVVEAALRVVREALEGGQRPAPAEQRELPAGVDDADVAATLERTRTELRRILRRDAEVFLALENARETTRELSERAETFQALAQQRALEVERLGREIEYRDASFATLLPIVSTLRLALAESVARDARAAAERAARHERKWPRFPAVVGSLRKRFRAAARRPSLGTSVPRTLH